LKPILALETLNNFIIHSKLPSIDACTLKSLLLLTQLKNTYVVVVDDVVVVVVHVSIIMIVENYLL
jgi:hypothetical protein